MRKIRMKKLLIGTIIGAMLAGQAPVLQAQEVTDPSKIETVIVDDTSEEASTTLQSIPEIEDSTQASESTTEDISINQDNKEVQEDSTQAAVKETVEDKIQPEKLTKQATDKAADNKVISKASDETSYDKTRTMAKQMAKVLNETYKATSVQYAFIDNGEIVVSGQAGYFNTQKKQAPTKNSMYGIASISKMFATTAIMKLVDEGKVNLDTPITAYIPEFVMEDSRYQQITTRMLLNHSSGLMGSTFKNTILFDENNPKANDTLLKNLKKQRLKADPGAYSVYCNDGFSLAEIVVERVTGMTFTKYLDELLFNPLHLSNTKTPLSEFNRDRIAKGYVSGITNPVLTENFNALGAGGLYSSAEDLCRFATTFMNNSNGVLSSSSIAATMNQEARKGTWAKGQEDNVLDYGLGWDTVSLYPFNQYGIKAVAKGGDSYFYHGNVVVLPEHNMAVAILTSGLDSTSDQMAASNILITALKEKGIITEIKPDKKFTVPTKAPMPESYTEFNGKYMSNYTYDVNISKEGTLTLALPSAGSTKLKLFYSSDGSFYAADGSYHISFVKEDNGEIYMQQEAYGTVPYLGQTASNSYIAQKIEAKELSADVKQAWDKRAGKVYLLLDEKYNSAAYILSRIAIPIANSALYPSGYFFNDEIIDANNALPFLQIPATGSRDQADARFYKAGNVEYLEYGHNRYIDLQGVKVLSTKKSFTTSIASSGYTKWFKVPMIKANQTVTIKAPKNSSFAVYNKNGLCTSYSLVSKKNKVTLPAGGYISFMGSKGAKFTVTY